MAAEVCDRLYCLTLGHERIPAALAFERTGGDGVLRLPFTSILARSPDGWFLWDTGLAESIGRDPAAWGRFWQWGAPELPGDGDPLLEALEMCGVGVTDLAGALVSHLHVDHTGGLRHLAGGPAVVVHRAELEYALEEATEAQGYWRPDYDDPAIRWQPVDGDCRIAAGIHAIATPGHAPGHLSFRVDLAESGSWLFAFDAIPLQENVERDDPIAAGSRPGDAPLRRASHDRLVALARDSGARLVPGHCPDTWATLVAPPDCYR
ncbi:MAG: N-acyl homoserine lactonase family protein [Thermoleophilia bacterium]